MSNVLQFPGAPLTAAKQALMIPLFGIIGMMLEQLETGSPPTHWWLGMTESEQASYIEAGQEYVRAMKVDEAEAYMASLML